MSWPEVTLAPRIHSSVDAKRSLRAPPVSSREAADSKGGARARAVELLAAKKPAPGILAPWQHQRVVAVEVLEPKLAHLLQQRRRERIADRRCHVGLVSMSRRCNASASSECRLATGRPVCCRSRGREEPGALGSSSGECRKGCESAVRHDGQCRRGGHTEYARDPWDAHTDARCHECCRRHVGDGCTRRMTSWCGGHLPRLWLFGLAACTPIPSLGISASLVSARAWLHDRGCERVTVSRQRSSQCHRREVMTLYPIPLNAVFGRLEGEEWAPRLELLQPGVRVAKAWLCIHVR